MSSHDITDTRTDVSGGSVTESEIFVTPPSEPTEWIDDSAPLASPPHVALPFEVPTEEWVTDSVPPASPPPVVFPDLPTECVTDSAPPASPPHAEFPFPHPPTEWVADNVPPASPHVAFPFEHPTPEEVADSAPPALPRPPPPAKKGWNAHFSWVPGTHTLSAKPSGSKHNSSRHGSITTSTTGHELKRASKALFGSFSWPTGTHTPSTKSRGSKTNSLRHASIATSSTSDHGPKGPRRPPPVKTYSFSHALFGPPSGAHTQPPGSRAASHVPSGSINTPSTRPRRPSLAQAGRRPTLAETLRRKSTGRVIQRRKRDKVKDKVKETVKKYVKPPSSSWISFYTTTQKKLPSFPLGPNADPDLAKALFEAAQKYSEAIKPNKQRSRLWHIFWYFMLISSVYFLLVGYPLWPGIIVWLL